MGQYKAYTIKKSATSRSLWLANRRRQTSGVDGAELPGTSAIIGGQGIVGDGGAGSEALARLNDMFERVNIGTDEEPVYAIRAKYGFFSDSFVSAGGMNTTE